MGDWPWNHDNAKHLKGYAIRDSFRGRLGAGSRGGLSGTSRDTLRGTHPVGPGVFPSKGVRVKRSD